MSEDTTNTIVEKTSRNCGTGFQPVRFELLATRRNLPHMQHGGSTYFITFRTARIELTKEARKIVLDSVAGGGSGKYCLWAATIMPDHAHLIVTPGEIRPGEWHSLSGILHSIKSFTAKKINALYGRRGRVWQDESYDRIIRDADEYFNTGRYIMHNAPNKGLCDSPEQWDSYYESPNAPEHFL